MINSPVLLPTSTDISFHSWCDSMGLAVNPSVQLITSTQSVAGRGVFAIDDLEEGEKIARIPSGLVLYPENAAECFPETAATIEMSKKEAGIANDGKRFGWVHKLWRKVIRRGQRFYEMDTGDTWHPELTLYALAALEEEHPWSEWISQWNRDDPAYRLFSSNSKVDQEEAIDTAVDELQNMMPHLSKLSLKAALALRLNRLGEERRALSLNDDTETSAMHSLVSSRAIGFDGLFTGVIPFHDMINHSLDPNITLEFNGECLELVTKEKVEKGQELFLCYTDIGGIDENDALWALIQWGIPTTASDYINA